MYVFSGNQGTKTRHPGPLFGAVFCKFHEILHCSVSKSLTKTAEVSIFWVSKLEFFQICFIMSYNVIIIQFKRDLMSFETDGAVKKYDRITSLLLRPRGFSSPLDEWLHEAEKHNLRVLSGKKHFLK